MIRRHVYQHSLKVRKRNPPLAAREYAAAVSVGPARVTLPGFINFNPEYLDMIRTEG